MKKNFSLIFVAILTCSLSIKLNAQETVKRFYNNPIITGYNADPSICKAGNNYYVVNSTQEYFPGIPVYHSTDLVNWEMIGHVLDRPSQLDLTGYDCSQGIYAPTIRYNKGTFYTICTLVSKGKGAFICTASNPAGPWSDPHWIKDAMGIDHDLFFDDDGKVYMSGTLKPKSEVRLWEGHNTLWTQEIDILNFKLVGERKIQMDAANFTGVNSPLEGGSRAFLNSFEGPHIYKKDGLYYFTFSQGGTGLNHAFVVFKSKNVFGPWECNPANPVLTHRDLPANHPITAPGHADLVQIEGNNFALVHLGKRPYQGANGTPKSEKVILGRETFLLMVDWSGEWPVVNPKGKIGRSELVLPCPDIKENKFDKIYLNDDFNTAKLHPQWNFVRTPLTEWWSLTERKGFLRIQLRPEMISEKVNPSFICKRQEHVDFTVTAKMQFAPKTENEEAGILINRDLNNYLKFTLCVENKEDVLKLALRNGDDTNDAILAKAKIKSENIILKLSAVGYYYSFSYTEDGKKWNILKNNVDFSTSKFINAGKFTGPFIGMYASSNGLPSRNSVDFDWFYYKGGK